MTRCNAFCYVLAALFLCVAFVQGSEGSTNNWAVLVNTSRYWFNYRHMANTMGMYRTVKRLGIPDSQIILMLADDMACNPRNMYPGTVYSNKDRKLDLYGDAVEVDYRGDEVTVENFIRLLTDRVSHDTPASKRLNTDEHSNIFIYMTGHGGDEFLKFQDVEEISAFDLADSVESMHTKKRYNEIFFMVDTCQANTLYSRFYSPNIFATGSSAKDQNSYSHHADKDIGIAVIDRFTHFALNFFEGVNKTSQATFQDFFNAYNPSEFLSNPGIRTDLFHRPMASTKLTEFFGGVSQAEVFELSNTESQDELRQLDALPPRPSDPWKRRSQHSKTASELSARAASGTDLVQTPNLSSHTSIAGISLLVLVGSYYYATVKT